MNEYAEAKKTKLDFLKFSSIKLKNGGDGKWVKYLFDRYKLLGYNYGLT